MMNLSSIDLASTGVPTTAEEILAFGTVWPELAPSIERFARLITPERDHQQDLIQEAMVALWNADSTRYNFRERADVAYVRRMLINRMWDVWGDDGGHFREQADALRRDLAAGSGVS